MLAGFLSLISDFFCCQNNNKQTNSEESKIVFRDSLGNTLTESDLINTTGQVNYEIAGSENIDARAKKLHQEARVLGSEGKYDLAIVKLEEAIKIQPDWAYPVYDLAFTYLLKGDFDSALKFYKNTDELKPNGFFTSKTAIYSLEGEREGKFPKGLYLYYLKIEWAAGRNEKLEIAKTVTERTPDFAPAWKDLANLLDDKKEKLYAIEQGLLKNPDAETKGVLIINKAIILKSIGRGEEAIELLSNLIFSQNVTTGNLEKAKYTLKSFIKDSNIDK